MNVIDIFKEISKIPRETGHEEKLPNIYMNLRKKEI